MDSTLWYHIIEPPPPIKLSYLDYILEYNFWIFMFCKHSKIIIGCYVLQKMRKCFQKSQFTVKIIDLGYFVWNYKYFFSIASIIYFKYPWPGYIQIREKKIPWLCLTSTLEMYIFFPDHLLEKHSIFPDHEQYRNRTKQPNYMLNHIFFYSIFTNE